MITKIRYQYLSVLCVLLVYSHAAETMIKKTIVIEESIPTALMQTAFTIEKAAKDPNEILKSFGMTNKSIIELTKSEDITCKGGQNRINLDYIVSEKNQRVFSGYRGSVSYVCTFDKIQAYNALLNASFDNGQKLNLSPIQWIATEAKKKEAQKAAEQRLVTEAQNTAVDYSSLLNAKCSLKSMEIASHIPHPQPVMTFAKAERLNNAAFVENFSPIQDNVILNLSGMVEVLCEK